ncbi:MAG: S46 family peptidase [Bacteroidetes bacterium]|nr:MAG: S46 family peptidase [Bacteroidota bacterium]
MLKVFKVIVIFSLVTSHQSLLADEGMWVPLLLNKNIGRMQQMGCRLSAEDIYSINQSSLKDAIVRFGRGCTGEVVSPNGLLLTNHHCGFGAIQRHSNLEHDYLTNGYWAASMEEELPNPGLTITFLVRMEDVTARVLEGVTDSLPEQQRDSLIRKNSRQITKEATGETHYEAQVIPFFHDNQFLLYVTEEFRDIRFVGAPPSGIGNFGGDTDNWMWPRHTGDFSVFRIYADTNNQPADYSSANVPYKPKRYLPVSLGGYEEGDFALLFGNPGTTREYLPAVAVEQIAFKENPVKIGLRQKRLDIIGYAMDTSRLVRIQYASKRVRIANYWKKMIGETRGIRRADGVAEKQRFEEKFQSWAAAQRNGETRYELILPGFAELYKTLQPIALAEIYLGEAGMAPEIFGFALSFGTLIDKSQDKSVSDETVDEEVKELQQRASGFYKDYQPLIDQEITSEMLGEMQHHMEPASLPGRFEWITKKYDGNVKAYVDELFASSLFADSARLYAFLGSYDRKSARKLTADPAYMMAKSISKRYQQDILPAGKSITTSIDSLQRIYMKALMEMQPDRQFYPDANSTLRVCFGEIRGFEPANGVDYYPFTTVRGILEKEDSTIYDYAVDQRLNRLISAADYGRYADPDGTLHVAFISTIHSTGGNSGAPVLNGNGELIGINFDRNWEGTMSDLLYDPGQCRNIVLDIRYLLFIMDKYAGASWLLREMDIR